MKNRNPDFAISIESGHTTLNNNGNLDIEESKENCQNSERSSAQSSKYEGNGRSLNYLQEKQILMEKSKNIMAQSDSGKTEAPKLENLETRKIRQIWKSLAGDR